MKNSEIQKRVRKNYSLEIHLLRYLNNHRNIPYVEKTINYDLKSFGFKTRYMSMTLSRLSSVNFITKLERGIYCFTEENFKKIKFANPQLAKQISLKEN